jgi:hypothetical protein
MTSAVISRKAGLASANVTASAPAVMPLRRSASRRRAIRNVSAIVATHPSRLGRMASRTSMPPIVRTEANARPWTGGQTRARSR